MTDPAVLALLREIRDEITALRADVRRRGVVSLSLSRADCVQLSRLLPVVAGVLGSEPFLARDLFELDSAALRLALRGWTAIRLGRLLQRAEGQALDGYLVEREGVELHATLWRVLQVSGSGLPATSPTAPR